MDAKLILYKRNKLLTYVLWFSLLLGVVSSVMTNSTQLWTLIILGGCIVLGATILVWKSWLSDYMMYYVVLALAIISYVMISTSSEFNTYFLVYYSIAVCTLYNKYLPILLSGIIGLIFTNYFFFTQRHTLFASFSDDSLITLNLFILLVTGALLASGIFGERLQQTTSHQQKQILIAHKHSEDVLQYIRESIKGLDQFSTDLKTNIDSTGVISKEMTSSFNELSNSTENVSTSLNMVSSSIQTLNSEVLSISNSSSDLHDISAASAKLSTKELNTASQLQEEMKKVNSIIETTVLLIQSLNKRNENISEILKTIQEISEKTQLLALNAAIEAARAGEYGQGFTVVSSEIKKLSETTRESTEDISTILRDIQSQTEHVSQQVFDGQKAMKQAQLLSEEMAKTSGEMLGNTHQAADHSEGLSSTIVRFKDSSQNITTEMESLSAMTEQNMSEIKEILTNMKNQDNNISNIISRFHELDGVSKGLREQVNISI